MFKVNAYLKQSLNKNKFVSLNRMKLFFTNKIHFYSSTATNDTNLYTKNEKEIHSNQQLQEDNTTTELTFDSSPSAFFEKKTKDAADLLKVLNTQFDNLDVESLIKTLLLCGHFKNHPRELINKLEKKMLNLLASMSEDQLTRTLFGFTLLNHRSSSLSFVIERILNKKMSSINRANFTTIFKCFGKSPDSIVSQGLMNNLRTYIEMNKNKFTLAQLTDVFINYPKVLKTAPLEEEKKLISTIFLQIFPHVDKLDANRLVNFYFIIYSDKKKNPNVSSLFEKVTYNYEEKFINLFIDKEKEINNKLLYLIVLTHHFLDEAKFVYKNGGQGEQGLKRILSEFIFKKILNNLSLFTPEEINSIVTIVLQNKENLDFTKDELTEIKDSFINLVFRDLESMSVDEILLYMQSVLIIISESLKETQKEELVQPQILTKAKELLLKIEDEIMNKRMSSLDIFQTTSLLELIHHFKPLLKSDSEAYFLRINFDTITENLLKLLSMKTNEDLAYLFEDYYLTFLFLFDLKFRNGRFWTEYIKYAQLFDSSSMSSRMDKVKKLIDIIEEDLKLQLESYES